MPLFKRYAPEEGISQMGDSQVEAIEPMPENYVGDSIPYRGVVNHGVPVSEPFLNTDELEDAENPPVEYVPPVEPPEPVPVRIVTEASRERRYWRAYGFQVATTSTRIVSRNDFRRRLVIKNQTSGSTLRVSHMEENLFPTVPGTQPTNCFILGDSAQIELYSTEALWCRSDGAEVNVGVIEEYVVDED